MLSMMSARLLLHVAFQQCSTAALPRPLLCPCSADGEGGMRAGAIVGTCEEMCPAVERERRARLSDIQVWRWLPA